MSISLSWVLISYSCNEFIVALSHILGTAGISRFPCVLGEGTSTMGEHCPPKQRAGSKEHRAKLWSPIEGSRFGVANVMGAYFSLAVPWVQPSSKPNCKGKRENGEEERDHYTLVIHSFTWLQCHLQSQYLCVRTVSMALLSIRPSNLSQSFLTHMISSPTGHGAGKTSSHRSKMENGNQLQRTQFKQCSTDGQSQGPHHCIKSEGKNRTFSAIKWTLLQ